MASRRSRERQSARPWADPQDHDLEEDPEEADTEPFFLSTGERIDTHSAWQMPGQEQR